MEEHFRDIACHMTTRIEVIHKDGSQSTGTGFFHAFNKSGNQGKLCIVTNKHVIENYEIIKFAFTNTSQEGEPVLGHHKTFGYKYNKQLVQHHPDPEVDLVAIPIIPLINYAKSLGFIPFYKYTDKSLIAGKELFDEIFATADILMIGYPIGIWDEVNNLPIIRTGICATPPNVKYNGKNEFVIDAHCFPGSSGSPVFIAEAGTIYSKKTNSVSFGSRIALLGILYAGPQFTSKGEIIVKNIPTNSVPFSKTNIPAGLGHCINASELDIIEKKLSTGVEINEGLLLYFEDDKKYI